MSINTLQDIRTAVRNYLDTNVTITLSISPLEGNVVNPGENFQIKIKGVNANAANGGVCLTNVRWYVRTANSSIAKLIVPAATFGKARTGYHDYNTELTPGDVVNSMYIFPQLDTGNYLHVGDVDTITIMGKAYEMGDARIYARIYADLDLEHLFPKNENTIQASSVVEVID